MTDLWSFLLQTLTASGAAALLLAVKALFRDKLSPRWQFGVWGVLALVLLLPAGGGGRYALFNWPLWVESAKTALTGDYSLTRVLAPIPLPLGLGRPASPADLLYLLYLAGAAALLLRYALSYLRLRLALRQGAEADGAQIRRVAAAYGCRPCRAVAVPGLSSAFVCGVFRPVLALPAERPVDDKVILHELLHLRFHDAAWGLLICLFRCLHWCNPLLWICADLAQNDAESLCDQRVLERLEGEERRDYGRILLSMADDRYARAPGTSSMANGGRNIRARIQAIARFRRYPAGMALVSVCIAAVLALPALFGTRAGGVVLGSRRWDDALDFQTAMASARVARCTTAAAALDAYGKAVLEQNGIYRALCAPLEEHPALAAEMEAAATGPDHWVYTRWESGLPGYPDPRAGYFLYNLTPDSGGYRALMVFPLQWAYPDGPDQPPASDPDCLWLASRPVRAERREDRWVVLPQEAFTLTETSRSLDDGGWLVWGDASLPAAATYAAETEQFRLELRYQTVHVLDNAIQSQTGLSWHPGASAFDTAVKPYARFARAYASYSFTVGFTGNEDQRAALGEVRYAAVPLSADGSHPALKYGAGSGSSSTGAFWGNSSNSGPSPWDGTLSDGGGTYLGGDPNDTPVWPAGYLVELTAGGTSRQATLLPVEGGAE